MPDGDVFTLQPVDHDPWAPAPGAQNAADARDAQLAATMTHQPQAPPNPATVGLRNAVAGAGAFLSGGLSGVANRFGVAQPAWSDRIRETLNAPDVQSAIGMSPALGMIKAFHGSPYNFDQFDMSKVGTGEGAQAYGHGLYFAENPAVAEGYKAKLSIGNLSNPNDVAATYLKALSDRPTAIQALRDNAKNFAEGHAVSPDVLHQAADLLEKGVEPKPPGKVYEVNINAEPEHFLDWDKPLSEQSPQIQAAVKKLARSYDPSNTGSVALNEIAAQQALNQGRIGQAAPAYERNSADVSSALRDAGVPGIKYLDQGSRAAGAGTNNYVVFNDRLIDIAKKYGLAGLIAGGAAHFSLPAAGVREQQ
jgi:hypothetical protein